MKIYSQSNVQSDGWSLFLEMGGFTFNLYHGSYIACENLKRLIIEDMDSYLTIVKKEKMKRQLRDTRLMALVIHRAKHKTGNLDIKKIA